MNSEQSSLRVSPHLELRLLLGQLAELFAETKSAEHGIIRGDGQVGSAGDATIGVDARQGELEQVILPTIATLQTGTGDLVWPRDAMAFLGEHGDYVIQVFLTG